ncbi:trimeric intracellular cation channel family protein [Roseobacter sp. YSTF-M11]|uniref:Trimeric intracellular cation channel family protein n=1 Tax=Roseobacter insulae TaxID=2859783 RepID=A0A9X1FUD2_9RHOB|nr:trimeric intracellular cation channel family protein [Roseobacter insulae]MBW4707275.1 trimeric intracellular cation channel family protein [Roseobacter insulae]
MTLIAFLDFASVFIFALTGALVASRQQLDIVGFAFVACLTAVGGGTLRDVLLDRNPIFWIAQPMYIGVACAAAVLVFFTAHRFESRLKTLIWLDTFALAVAVPAGTGVALSLDQPTLVVVLMGTITGCMGGLLRDVVLDDLPVVLKQGELYVTAAVAGATVAALARPYFPDALIPLMLCALVTWALRAGSLAFGWRLPVYKSRPPRV